MALEDLAAADDPRPGPLDGEALQAGVDLVPELAACDGVRDTGGGHDRDGHRGRGEERDARADVHRCLST